MPGSGIVGHTVVFFKESPYCFPWASLVAQLVKNLPAMQETWGSIPGSEKSPKVGNGNPLQYSCFLCKK